MLSQCYLSVMKRLLLFLLVLFVLTKNTRELRFSCYLGGGFSIPMFKNANNNNSDNNNSDNNNNSDWLFRTIGYWVPCDSDDEEGTVNIWQTETIHYQHSSVGGNAPAYESLGRGFDTRPGTTKTGKESYTLSIFEGNFHIILRRRIQNLEQKTITSETIPSRSIIQKKIQNCPKTLKVVQT